MVAPAVGSAPVTAPTPMAAAQRARARSTKVLAARALTLGLATISLTVPARAEGQAGSALAAHPLAAHVAEAAQRFGIPERWIWSVMRAESGGNPRAVSRAGAQGLMQIMPSTWALLARRFGLGSDPFDARANIHGGAAYLRLMWDRYRSIGLMLAAYNAGPGRADAYAAGARGLPAETIAYIARIAPALDASTPAAIAPAPAQLPRSWRDAALFAEPASRPAPTADRRSREPQPPHDLFIPLSGQERR